VVASNVARATTASYLMLLLLACVSARVFGTASHTSFVNEDVITALKHVFLLVSRGDSGTSVVGEAITALKRMHLLVAFESP